jgi:hypothetical protein
MFFNYDSFELLAATFVVSGMLITYTFYKGSTTVNNESLVNTNSSLDSISNLDSNIQLDNLPNSQASFADQYVDVGIQTEVNIQVEASVQSANSYINTGMQTSARMWYQTVKNWIDELLSKPAATGQYVDVGVQAETRSTWQIVKDWFRETCSVRSSELTSMGNNKVTKWRNNLDSTQSVDLNDSESSLTTLKFGSDTELQNLVDPNDSVSNISEVISESSLQIPSNTVYDINVYNQEFIYENLNNVSNHIDYSYVIDGVTHAVLVTADKIFTIDPNLIIFPNIC